MCKCVNANKCNQERIAGPSRRASGSKKPQRGGGSTLHTYVTLAGHPAAPELGGLGYPGLALAGTAEVFKPGLSTNGETVRQITSLGVRVSFKKSLALQPSKVAIKGTAVGKRSDSNVDIVRS
jgi:hypothetical protein